MAPMLPAWRQHRRRPARAYNEYFKLPDTCRGFRNTMYALSHNEIRNALDITIEGFWSPDMFKAFERDVTSFVQRITRDNRRHMVIVNVSKAVLQTQEMIRHFQTLIETTRPEPTKMAFIATTALSRMQARRLLLRDNIRLFEDMASADEWLDGS